MIPLHDDNPTQRTSIVTITIIAACVVVYFAVQPTPFTDTAADQLFNYRHAMVPYEIWHGSPVTVCQVVARLCGSKSGAAIVAPGKHVYLAPIEALFLHGSIMHLLGNVLFLWVFGNNVEDRLGRVRYALFYLAAGIIAGLGYVAINSGSTTPLLGASGAIAGTMGAYLVWFPRARVLTLVSIIPIRLPAWLVLVAWFVLQFFTSPGSQVAWVAHVIGFAFGALTALVVGERTRPRPTTYATPLPPPPGSWPPP